MKKSKKKLSVVTKGLIEEVPPNIPPLNPNPNPCITFSYPYGNGFDPAWVESLIGLLLYEVSKPKETRILGSILKAGSCYVDNNRDKLAIDFNNTTKDDWLLMIDPDVAFPANILETFASLILENPEAKIISGRVDLLNGLPVFYKHDEASQVMTYQPFAFKGLKEFDRVGTGIIAFAREVFVTLHKHHKHAHYFNKMIINGLGIGDDFSFCERARECGYKLYGAWDIRGIHWKPQPCRQAYLELEQLEIKVGQ